MYIDWLYIGKIVLRLGLSVVMGSVIGNERAKHWHCVGICPSPMMSFIRWKKCSVRILDIESLQREVEM